VVSDAQGAQLGASSRADEHGGFGVQLGEVLELDAVGQERGLVAPAGGVSAA
jgi:hypothetical protein